MVAVELLERDGFLQTLARWQRQALAEGGRLVFIGGEAGVGKTSLVSTFCESAAAGSIVLRGACDSLSTPRPLGPLVDIAGVVGGPFEQLLWSAAPRERVFHSFLTLLQAQRGPVLVVIEDTHWADDATLDLLRFIGRRISGTRALMLVTWRDDEVGPRHPLRVTLGDLATSGNIQRLHLTPLSEDAVRILAASSDLDPAVLYHQTGGNPFFVTEVLAAGAKGVPPTVRDAVLARAARLSHSARAVLDAAAVIGVSVEPWLLADVMGAEMESAEECIAAGMLRYEGERYMFRHAVARDAILAALGPQRSVVLHQAVLAALRRYADQPDALARLAHHAEAAGDQAAVLAYAPAAARRAVALSAHREAAAQFARALRSATSLPDSERALLLEEYAEERYLTDHLVDGIRAMQEALAIWRRCGNRLKEGESLIWLASRLVMAGRNPEAEEASRASIAVLESLPPGLELGRAYRVQSFLRMLDRDTDDAIAWGWRAIELAAQFNDVETLAHVYNSIGSAMLVANDLDGRLYLERSLAVAQEAGIAVQISGAYGNLGSALGEIHQFALAEPYLEMGIKFCTERDLDYARNYAKSWLSLCHLYLVRWQSAADLAASVLQHEDVSAVSRIMALLAIGRLRARRGDPDVWVVLDEALALADVTGTLQRLGPVRAARAEAAWLAGDKPRSLAEAGAAWDLAASRRHVWFTGEMCFWRWRSGACHEVPSWIAEPFALHIAGDWKAAARLWQERQCPYEQAQALADGDEAALRQALEIFERLGAQPMVAVVSGRLRQIGARGIPRGPRPSTRSNPANLTRRELQVLQLIVDGLRNSEIAERLFLSPKTVDNHVSSIHAKLEVRSRVDAAREALRLGIATPSSK